MTHIRPVDRSKEYFTPEEVEDYASKFVNIGMVVGFILGLVASVFLMQL
jgi:hypothetical protein